MGNVQLCYVRLRFEKSSPRWRIVGRECKILLVKFFNSLEIAKREEHEYKLKRVRAKRLINLCSCAQISRSEEMLVD